MLCQYNFGLSPLSHYMHEFSKSSDLFFLQEKLLSHFQGYIHQQSLRWMDFLEVLDRNLL